MTEEELQAVQGRTWEEWVAVHRVARERLLTVYLASITDPGQPRTFSPSFRGCAA